MVSRQFEQIGGLAQGWFVERRPKARRNRATADGCGRRGWWARSRQRWAKDARRRAARKNPRDGASGRRRPRRRATPGAGAARRRTADLCEEFGRAERARRRLGKPPRRPRRRRQPARSAAAPKTEPPVPPVGWSARNWVRRAGATAVRAGRRAPRRANRRREFRRQGRRRARIGPWPEHNPRRRFVIL